MRVPNYGGAIDMLTGVTCPGGVATLGYSSNVGFRPMGSSWEETSAFYKINTQQPRVGVSSSVTRCLL